MKKKTLLLAAIIVIVALVCALSACVEWPDLNTPENSAGSTTGTTGGSTQQDPVDPSNNTHTYDTQLDLDTSQPTTSTLADTLERISNSVVEIYVDYASKTGAGAGTIIAKEDGDYLILTCMHVVDGAESGSAESIRARTNDGSTYAAVFLGGVPDNDIAVLRITTSDQLSVAQIRDVDASTSRLRVGEDAIAIGNPLGILGGSVSKGIISAINRNVTIEGYSMNLLQLDTAVNNGNSGGGLFDKDGKLIGVVNAKVNTSTAVGIGFAIPINDAIGIANDIIKTTGNPETDGLGYKIGKVMTGVTTSYQSGILAVEAVDPYGAAYNKLRAGDIIQTIDGVAVSGKDALQVATAQKKVGDTMVLQVSRRTSNFSTSREQVEVTLTLNQYVYGYRAS